MRRRRIPLGIFVPIALLALVGTLASLQYKWLGQVGEAERDELRASLERRTRDFSDEFDREITRAYTTFRPRADQADAATAEALSRALTDWRASAAFPELVKRVFVYRQTSQGSELSVLTADGSRLEAVDWTDELAPVRARVANPIERLPTINDVRPSIVMYALGSTTVVSDVPALLLPLPSTAPISEAPVFDRRMAPGTGDLTFKTQISHDFVIVEFDRKFLVETMLPALAERHFAQGRVHVAVVDGRSETVLRSGWPNEMPVSVERADVVIPFFMLRTEAVTRELIANGSVMTYSMNSAAGARNGGAGARAGGGAGGRAGSVPAPAGASRGTDRMSITVEQRSASGGFVRMSSGAWSVLVQHAAGSLDAAVAQTRLRNLWMSFGILSVLVVSIGLVWFNARRSERLAAQQMDFVATVSHELRTPLTVIRSAAQNLSAGVVHDSTQAKQYGDLIETEGRRLTDMVEQVLEFAGLSGNRRRPVMARPTDAGALARDVATTYSALVDAEGIAVQVDVAPDLPLVLVDEGALRRALQNLVVNAIKYGADGRWIGISAQAATTRGEREVQISVSDRGRGIDPAELVHIFEPFYRGQFAVERQIHGNGLGLSLVKRIAEAHGGRVTVKSAAGQGATFTLHLPAATPDTAPVTPLSESPAAPTA